MVLVIDTDAAAWALSALAVSGALVRLVLAGLAVHAARKALGSGTEGRRGPDGPAAATPAERAHRLAVLRALLKGLRELKGP